MAGDQVMVPRESRRHPGPAGRVRRRLLLAVLVPLLWGSGLTSVLAFGNRDRPEEPPAESEEEENGKEERPEAQPALDQKPLAEPSRPALQSESATESASPAVNQPAEIAQAGPAPGQPGRAAAGTTAAADAEDEEPWPEVAGPLGVSRFPLASRELDLLLQRIEADRRLLGELRKELPQDRAEAELYLARLRILAGQSDPVRLSPLANKLMLQSRTFFDWVENEYETPEERVQDYYIGGARGFYVVMEEFKREAMFIVINRLDIASQLLIQGSTQ